MLVEHKTTLFPETRFAPPPPPPESGTFGSAFGAAFQLENPFAAALRWSQRETFAPDLTFDFDSAARNSQAFSIDPEAFFDVLSLPEFRQKEIQILEETRLRERAASNGLGGFLGAMTGSILSPSSLLPAGTIYKGARVASILKSTVSASAAAAGATTIDEFILQQEQELRSGKETALNIIGAAVLGGLLGGAVSGLSRRDVVRITGRMAQSESDEAISALEHTQSVGAAVNPDPDYLDLPEVQGLDKSVPILDKGFQALSPAARNLANEASPTARALQASLDTGGLSIDMVGGTGGDVRSLTKQWYTLLYDALNKRKEIMGGNFVTRAMGVREFSEQVSNAIRREGQHENPAVAEYAAYVQKNVFDRMLKEAQRVNMPGFAEITEEFAKKYAYRIPREGIVIKDHDLFVGMLQENFTEQLSAKWAARIERINELNRKDELAAEDLSLDAFGVKQLRNALEAEIKNLPEQFDPKIRDLAVEIRGLREQAKTAPRDKAKELRAQANDLFEGNKEALNEFNKAEKGLKGRFARLGRSASGLEAKQRKALSQIEALEERMDVARQRLYKQLTRMVHHADRWTRKEYEKGIDELEELVREYYEKWMKTSDRMAKLGYDLPEDFQSLVYNDLRQTDKASRLGLSEERLAEQRQNLEDTIDQLEALRNSDPEVAKAALENMSKSVIKATEEAQFKKAQRIEVLNKRIEKYDPEGAKVEAAKYRDRAATRQMEFLESAARNNIALRDGTADVSQAAKEYAEYVAQVYAGHKQSLPFYKILEERGPELARMLNIDETRVWANGVSMEHFIENDIEIIMRAYLRAMGPDIEMVRKFGMVNPMAADSKYLKAITDEFNKAKEEARGKYEGKKLDKELTRLAKLQDQTYKDLTAQIDRLRHNRGVPQDADAFGYQLGKFMLNLNTTRLMGKMVISSVVDLAGIVAKHGVTRTVKDLMVPMISDLKTLKLNRNEIRQAGIALDVTLHGRSAALYDVLDEYRNGWAVNRGLQFMVNNFGVVTLMDQWNTQVKMLAGHVTMARMSDALEAAAEGRISARDAKYLQRLGIGELEAKAIWKELSATGDRVNGILLPNTDQWKNYDALRTYRAAIARDVDDTIVTPGGEIPNFADSGMVGRLIFQFRSFTFSATQKLLYAGLQNARQGDLALVSGAIFSIALGMLSYYIWALSSGPEQTEAMQEADWDKWLTEGIKRSFILGPLAEVQRFAENSPGPLSTIATLGTGKTSKSTFKEPVWNALGPSVGLVTDFQRVFMSAIDGEPMRDSEVSALRRLIPYQNLWALSRAFTAIEEGLQK